MRISDWSSDVCSSDLESQPPVESRLSHRRIQAQMTTHYRQLTQGQRYQIEAGLSAAESQASIAKRVGVHPSTISREVRRDSTQNIYKAVSAAHESDARRAGARKFCKPATWLSHHLPVWLKHGMSPDQIPQRLKQEQNGRASRRERGGQYGEKPG